jgi:hypothetical protein
MTIFTLQLRGTHHRMAPARQDLTEKKKVFSKNHRQITRKYYVTRACTHCSVFERMLRIMTTDMFMDNQQQIINATIPFLSMKLRLNHTGNNVNYGQPSRRNVTVKNMPMFYFILRTEQLGERLKKHN